MTATASSADISPDPGEFASRKALTVLGMPPSGGETVGFWAEAYLGYGQDKHETHSGPASPCVEALARPRRRVWPPEGLPVL